MSHCWTAWGNGSQGSMRPIRVDPCSATSFLPIGCGLAESRADTLRAFGEAVSRTGVRPYRIVVRRVGQVAGSLGRGRPGETAGCSHLRSW